MWYRKTSLTRRKTPTEILIFNRHLSIVHSKRRFPETTHHILFFISLSFPMTSTGFVLPVAFCTAGSWRKTVSDKHSVGPCTDAEAYLDHHEGIMFLGSCQWMMTECSASRGHHLFIPDSKLARRFRILCHKRFEALDCFIVENCGQEFDVGFGIFMAGLK